MTERPDSNDLQPSVDEVLQVEIPDDAAQAVPVRLVGSDVPQRVQDLPRKAGATRSQTITNTTYVRILRADHRRATARIWSVGQNVLVAFRESDTQDDSRCALIPAGAQITVNTVVDVWVKSATATTIVSFITELWATGDGA